MKKNILVSALFSFILFSCDSTSGGNKNIIPVSSESQEVVDPHAAHAHADSVKAEPAAHEHGHVHAQPSDSAETHRTEAAEAH
ncbi:MAG: hypothetical protein LBP34_05630 [Flavobacteriaceae bacterium]|jgi:hypothetical protein|nr:hypothetical protein [Flavobacteriaceae bacterium]